MSSSWGRISRCLFRKERARAREIQKKTVPTPHTHTKKNLLHFFSISFPIYLIICLTLHIRTTPLLGGIPPLPFINTLPGDVFSRGNLPSIHIQTIHKKKPNSKGRRRKQRKTQHHAMLFASPPRPQGSLHKATSKGTRKACILNYFFSPPPPNTTTTLIQKQLLFQTLLCLRDDTLRSLLPPPPPPVPHRPLSHRKTPFPSLPREES